MLLSDSSGAGINSQCVQACPKGIDCYFDNTGGGLFNSDLYFWTSQRADLCGGRLYHGRCVRFDHRRFQPKRTIGASGAGGGRGKWAWQVRLMFNAQCSILNVQRMF